MYLTPMIYLYGRHGGSEWKATLDVIKFAKQYVPLCCSSAWRCALTSIKLAERHRQRSDQIAPSDELAHDQMACLSLYLSYAVDD